MVRPVLDITSNNCTADKKYRAGFFKKILTKAARQLRLKGKRFELSINLVGEDRIRTLNKKYRGKNKATDVLSFPLNEEVGTGATAGGIIALGDIFICLPTAKEYALKEDKSLSSQLALLTVHGFLHLLGYDHEKSKKEERKMAKLQNRILAKLSSL